MVAAFFMWVALALILAWFFGALSTANGDEAVELNLFVRGFKMAKIGDTFVVSIAPTTAAGNPATVTDVVYSVDPAVYDIVVGPDFLSAVVTAKGPGSSTVRVTAKSLGGVDLADEKPLADVEAPDLEAVALNLTVA